MTTQPELLTDQLVDDTAIMEPTTETEGTDSFTESTDESAEPAQSPLEQLINARTGFFQVSLDLADLKWIKAACNGKFSFTGPNEAFMVMNCYLGFASAIAKIEEMQREKQEVPKSIEIQAAAVEAAALLLSKYTASSLEAAQRTFRIAIALNGPAMQMKELDKQINILKSSSIIQEEMKDVKAN